MIRLRSRAGSARPRCTTTSTRARCAPGALCIVFAHAVCFFVTAASLQRGCPLFQSGFGGVVAVVEGPADHLDSELRGEYAVNGRNEQRKIESSGKKKRKETRSCLLYSLYLLYFVFTLYQRCSRYARHATVLHSLSSMHFESK